MLLYIYIRYIYTYIHEDVHIVTWANLVVDNVVHTCIGFACYVGVYTYGMDSYQGKSLVSNIKAQIQIDANEKRKQTFKEGDLVKIHPLAIRPETGWLARKGEIGTVNKKIILDNKKMVYVKFPR